MASPVVRDPPIPALSMPTITNLLNQPLLAALLILAAFLVGLSKGGLPSIAMLSVPLLSIFISPLAAAALLLPIYILSDLIGIYLYRREFSLPNIKILIPTGVLGVIIGWATASVVSDKIVAALIGAMGIVFCLYSWLKKKRDTPPAPVDFKKGVFWGTLAGFTSFVAHAGSPPFQVYTLPQKLPKMVFAGTTTLVFAVVNLAKVIPYSSIYPYTAETFKISAVLLPVAAIGTVTGKKLIEQLPGFGQLPAPQIPGNIYQPVW